MRLCLIIHIAIPGCNGSVDNNIWAKTFVSHIKINKLEHKTDDQNGCGTHESNKQILNLYTCSAAADPEKEEIINSILNLTLYKTIITDLGLFLLI